MTPQADHLFAFSAMLAADSEAGQLHTRHLQVIGLLCAQGPLSVSAVAALTELDGPTISRLAIILAERGLLTRTEAPQDRRMTLLTATQTGRALDARVRAHFAAARTPADTSAGSPAAPGTLQTEDTTS